MKHKLFIITIVTSLFFSCSNNNKVKEHPLPYFGEKNLDDYGNELPHKVAQFSFINQDSVIVTEEFLRNKITVVNFFFTTCPTICPTMTKNMSKIQSHWNNKNMVQFLSHTVDPKTDTPKKLKRYSKFYKANLTNWNFVTGNKEELYEAGVLSYLLPSQEDALAPGGFLHSEYFVLVDQNLNLRGFYDGTKEIEMEKLNADIKKLLND
jgi:protein SCO1